MEPELEALLNESLRMQRNGDLAGAASLLERQRARTPDSAPLLEALGNIRHAQGALPAAVETYRASLKQEPTRTASLWGVACALATLGDFAAAVPYLSHLVALRPDFGEGFHNLGRALYELGQVDEAMQAFQSAFHALPSESRALPLTNMAMISPGAPGLGNVEILAIRSAWASQCLPHLSTAGTAFPDHDSDPRRRLRLGYVSAFYSRRNWMKPVWGLIANHDREQFEVHLFSDGPPPAAEHGHKGCDPERFHDTGTLSNEAVVRLIQEQQIDILIDLNGYSKPPRLGVFTLRAAPVQVAWFNMFATSGLNEMDHLIGDQHVISPQDEQVYSERIVRVAGSYLTFEVGYLVPDVAPLPWLTNGFLTFGCLAPQYKITPQVIAAWSRILAAVPRARLLLKNVLLEHESARALVWEQFVGHGIAVERIDLEGPAEHLAFLERYGAIDIALDTFPYNGGTTTMEALWQGVPVLSFAGDRWAARISASLMNEAGLQEFVARGVEDHISQVIALATDPATPARLAALRSSMRERLRESSVCDVGSFRREMERLYRALWQAWCAGDRT